MVAWNDLRVDQETRVAFGICEIAAFGQQPQHAFAADERQVRDRHAQPEIDGIPGGGKLCAAPIGGFPGDALPVPRQRRPDAGPAAAPVSIRLVEDTDAPTADLYEIFHQSRGFLGVGRAQIEREFTVGRLALWLRAGEGEEQKDVLVLEFLQDRQNPGDGGRPHIAEQEKDLVVQHQFHGVVNRCIRLIAVIVELQRNPPA